MLESTEKALGLRAHSVQGHRQLSDLSMTVTPVSIALKTLHYTQPPEKRLGSANL